MEDLNKEIETWEEIKPENVGVYLSDKRDSINIDGYSDAIRSRYAYETNVQQMPKSDYVGMVRFNNEKTKRNPLTSAFRGAWSGLLQLPAGVDNAVTGLSEWITNSIYSGNIEAQKEITEAANALRQKNDAWLKEWSYQKEEKDSSFAFDFGQGGGSMFAAIGLSILTRNPNMAATMFGASQYGNLNKELREKGFDINYGNLTALVGGIAEGGLEKFGLHMWFENYASKKIGTFLIKQGATEFVQESSQQAAEEFIMRVSGGRVDGKSFLDVVSEVLYAGALGGMLGFVGGGVSIPATQAYKGRAQKVLEQGGMSKDEASRYIEAHLYGNEKQQKELQDKVNDTIKDINVKYATLEFKKLGIEEEQAKEFAENLATNPEEVKASLIDVLNKEADFETLQNNSLADDVAYFKEQRKKDMVAEAFDIKEKIKEDAVKAGVSEEEAEVAAALEANFSLRMFEETGETPLEYYENKRALYETENGEPINESELTEEETARLEAAEQARAEEEDIPFFQFAGEKAQTAALDDLYYAQLMEQDGESKEKILRDTGWFKGADGKWRFEISDKNAIIKESGLQELNKGNSVKLEDILDHKDLYKAYPTLANIEVKIDESLAGTSTGAYVNGASAEDMTIYVRPGEAEDSFRKILLHEIQHDIQTIEGFARGGNENTVSNDFLEKRNEKIQSERDAFWENKAKELLGKEAKEYLDARKKEEVYGKKMGDAGEKLGKLKREHYWENNTKKREKLEERINKLEAKHEEYRKEWWKYSEMLAGKYFETEQKIYDALKKETAKNPQRYKILDKYMGGLEGYRRLYGEIEARNTEARSDLTGRERLERTPESTQDVSNADAIVIFDDGTAMAYQPEAKNEVFYQTEEVERVKDYTDRENPSRIKQREIENLLPEEKEAFDRFIQSRHDGDRILANLQKNKYDDKGNLTGYYRTALEDVFIQQAIMDYAEGKAVNFESAIDVRTSGGKISSIKDLLQSEGFKKADTVEKRIEYLADNFIDGASLAHPAKVVNAVNSSLLNCNPSRDCAIFCYATHGNYARGSYNLPKSEVIDLVARYHPKKLAQIIAKEYKATTEYNLGKALRLFDKGDGDAHWVEVAKELNKQGVRVAIFTKKPDFMRQINDLKTKDGQEINLTMLSIDSSNQSLADENKDLKVAYVYQGEQNLKFVKNLQDEGRLSVVLPVKLNDKVMSKEEVEKLRENGIETKKICPIDAGWLKLPKGNKSPSNVSINGKLAPAKVGTWNCALCDRMGGVGCYFGRTTEKIIEYLKGSETKDLKIKEKDVKIIIDGFEEILKKLPITKGLTNEQLEQFGITEQDIAERVKLLSHTMGESDARNFAGYSLIFNWFGQRFNNVQSGVQNKAAETGLLSTKTGSVGQDNETAQSIYGTTKTGKGKQSDAERVSADISSDSRGNVNTKSEKFYQGEKTPLGSYMPASRVIHLFKKANRSTLIHELGHHFTMQYVKALEANGRTDKLEGFYNWLGINNISEATTETWEQMARGFETYVMEGEAPNIDTESLFQKFKKYLIGVYTDLKGKVIKPEEINDDVREFFDIMIAGEEEAPDVRGLEGKLDQIKSAISGALKGEEVNFEGLSTKDLRELVKLMTMRKPRKPKNLKQKIRSVGGIDIDFAKAIGIYDSKKGNENGFFKKGGIDREDSLIDFLTEEGYISNTGAETYEETSAIMDQVINLLENADNTYTAEEQQKIDERDAIEATAYEAAKTLGNINTDDIFKAIKVLQKYDIKPVDKNTLKYLNASIKQVEKLAKEAKKEIRQAEKDIANKQADLIDYVKKLPLSYKSQMKIIERLKRATLAKDFEKVIDEAAELGKEFYREEKKKMLAGMINDEIKSSRPKKVTEQKYDYKNNKLFKDLRDYSKMTQDQAAEQLSKAQVSEDTTDEDLIRMRYLNYKSNGAKTSMELLEQIYTDIIIAKQNGMSAKDDADFERSMNREAVRQAIIDAIDANDADKNTLKTRIGNLYRKGLTNLYSLINSISSKKLADAFEMETVLNDAQVKYHKQTEALKEKTFKVYGVKTAGDLLNKFADMGKTIGHLYNVDGIKAEEISVMKLIDIYNAMRNEKTRQDYINNYGEEQLDRLLSNLTPQDIAFADLMMEDINSLFPEVNKTYIKIYGMDLLKVENYWPATSEHTTETSMLGDYYSQQTTPSSWKERAKGRVTPIPQNAWTKYLKHINENIYMINTAEKYKELATVFKSKRIRNKITNKFGAGVYGELMSQISALSLNAKSDSLNYIESAFGSILNNFVVAKIAVAPTVFAGQLTSVTNYAENVKAGSFYKNFAEGLAHPKQTIKFMKEVSGDFLEARYKGGYAESISNVLREAEDAMSQKFRLISPKTKYNTANALSSFVRMGDIGAIIFGGYGQIKANLEAGMSMQEAIKRFEFDTLRSQQSSVKASLGSFQQSKGIARMFLAFKNTQHQYFRKIADAIINLQRGEITKTEAAKIIGNYALIQTTLYVMAKNLVNAGLGLLDDDDKITDGVLEQILLGTIDAIPFLSDALHFAYRRLSGQYSPNLVSMVGIDDIQKSINKFYKDEKSVYDYIEIITPLIEGTTSLPVQRFERTFKKWAGE